MLLQFVVDIVLLIFFVVVGVTLVVHLAQEVTGRAPFIPISKDVLDEIVSALELTKGSVLYDLGSGDGRVVFAAATYGEDVQVVGVERSFVPFVLSSFKRRRINSSNTKFIRANFFDVPVDDATHVFLYLFPGLMNLLLPKLQKELSPGTRVVSCDFKFKDKQPVKVIDMHRKKTDLGRKLYIYEF
jgi:precorrin-6B methylase 2